MWAINGGQTSLQTSCSFVAQINVFGYSPPNESENFAGTDINYTESDYVQFILSISPPPEAAAVVAIMGSL